MFSEEIKKLIDKIGGLIVVENNQPKFIFLSYEKFKEFVNFTKNTDIIHKNVDNVDKLDKIGVNYSESVNHSEEQSEEHLIEKLNKQILALKEEIEAKEKNII